MSSIKNHQSLPVLSHQQQFCAYSTCPLQSCHQRQIRSASHGFLITQHPHWDLCVRSIVDAIRNGVAIEDQVQFYPCPTCSQFMYTVDILKRCCHERSESLPLLISNALCTLKSCRHKGSPITLFQNHVSIHAVHIDNHAVYITLKTVAMRDHQSLPSFKSNCSCMPWVSSEMGAAIKGHQSQPTVSIFERNEGRKKWSSEMGVAIKGHQLQPTVSIF